MEKIYKSEDVASILGIQPRTVLEWVKERRLKASKVGKRYFISESDLLTMLKKAKEEND